MNSFTFTDAELKAAAGQVREAMLRSLPDPDKCTHEFSEAFNEKMRPLLARSERRQRGRNVLRSIAAILILLFISMTVWLSVDAEAREAVLNWVRQVYEDRVVYRFESAAQSGELPEYEVTWIPEGYEVVEEYEDETERVVVYYNETSGLGVVFDYHFINEESLEEVLFDDGTQVEKVTVNGVKADYYYDDESNVLMWVDKNDSIVYIINTQLDKESIIHIAESVVKK
jgi:hypothetical protein